MKPGMFFACGLGIGPPLYRGCSSWLWSTGGGASLWRAGGGSPAGGGRACIRFSMNWGEPHTMPSGNVNESATPRPRTWVRKSVLGMPDPFSSRRTELGVTRSG
jgi:hypothetical protein